MTTPTAEQLANRHVWVAALRSGSYRQARRVLRRNDRFCCLGVAEDVLDCTWESISGGDPSGLLVGAVATHVATHPGFELDDQGWTSLTYAARRGLGLPRVPFVTVRHPKVPSVWTALSLINLNDDLRFELSRIADVIEDQGEEWTGEFGRAEAEAGRRNRAQRLQPA